MLHLYCSANYSCTCNTFLNVCIYSIIYASSVSSVLICVFFFHVGSLGHFLIATYSETTKLISNFFI